MVSGFKPLRSRRAARPSDAPTVKTELGSHRQRNKPTTRSSKRPRDEDEPRNDYPKTKRPKFEVLIDAPRPKIAFAEPGIAKFLASTPAEPDSTNKPLRKARATTKSIAIQKDSNSTNHSSPVKPQETNGARNV